MTLEETKEVYQKFYKEGYKFIHRQLLPNSIAEQIENLQVEVEKLQTIYGDYHSLFTLYEEKKYPSNKENWKM
jgi:hypothetical protein